jgi:purine-nucleoside phosphorylase
MAEPMGRKKISIRKILDEIVEDESFSDEERELAQKKVMELEYREWCERQKKLRP